MESGRLQEKRSNFSRTCSLLSQYLKEKGSFVELGLGLSQNSELNGVPTRTMNLLPMIEKSAQSSDAPPPDSGQMTIFYHGQVIVFDDFPADKANEIITLASKSSTAAAAQNHCYALLPRNGAPKPAESVAGFPKFDSRTAQQLLLCSDLPIKRKNSLARFLDKRKDRIVATEPYQARNTAARTKSEA